jgi:hypothetical protein
LCIDAETGQKMPQNSQVVTESAIGLRFPECILRDWPEVP